jgi:hypothetical protein
VSGDDEVPDHEPSYPVSRLCFVRHGTTGAPVNTGIERAECIEHEGHTLRWRVWVAGPDGCWRPESWRPPVEWMLAQRRTTRGGAA